MNINGQHTPFIKIMMGVRQGDPLSPTLFGLFIEVLEMYMSKALGPDWQGQVPGVMGLAVWMLLYADDMVLIAETPAALQRQLDALAQFCTGWDMEVNLVKTKVVTFRPTRRRQPSQHHWAFQGQHVEQVESYKYLGVIFHAWQGIMQAPIHLAQSGHRAMYAMQGMCYSQGITDPSIRAHMWQQLVLPVVSYGSEVWGPRLPHSSDHDAYFANNPGEKVHMHFLRWYLGARVATHKQILLQAAGRLPLMQHWLQRTVTLWNKLTNVDPDSWLAHKAFRENVKLWREGCTSCWAARTISHLHRLGMLDGAGGSLSGWALNIEPSEVEKKMDSMMPAFWAKYQGTPCRSLSREDRVPGRTLYYYAQHYLGVNNNNNGRHIYHNIPASQWRPIMQMVTGQLQLHGVTRHWHGARRSTTDECPCCPQQLEDDVHFLLECPGYKDIRRQCMSIMATATAVNSGQNLQQCMGALFTEQTFAELAFYIRRARQRRFHVRGAQYMRDAAAAPIATPFTPVTLVDGDVDMSSSDDEVEVDDIDQAQS